MTIIHVEKADLVRLLLYAYKDAVTADGEYCCEGLEGMRANGYLTTHDTLALQCQMPLYTHESSKIWESLDEQLHLNEKDNKVT